MVDNENRLLNGYQAGLIVFKPEPATRAVGTENLLGGAIEASRTSTSQVQATTRVNRKRAPLPDAAGEVRLYTIADGLISNHRRGITIERISTGNIIRSNYIGTDISGTLDFGNIESGIDIGAAGNQIGGTLPGEGNVISGNKTGIRFSGVPATGNTIQGNFIGTRPDGTIGNVGNSYAGIFIDAASDNRIVGNSFHSNELIGIDTDTLGIEPNDTGDPDTGANRRQNYPRAIFRHQQRRQHNFRR